MSSQGQVIDLPIKKNSDVINNLKHIIHQISTTKTPSCWPNQPLSHSSTKINNSKFSPKKLATKKSELL